jgi:uncharacterized membrane protein
MTPYRLIGERLYHPDPVAPRPPKRKKAKKLKTKKLSPAVHRLIMKHCEHWCLLFFSFCLILAFFSQTGAMVAFVLAMIGWFISLLRC